MEKEWSLVPTAEGKFELVHTETAMNETIEGVELKFNVIFRLFTRSDPNTPEIIDPLDEASLKASRFSRWRPTRLFIHGWNPDPLAPMFTEGLFSLDLLLGWNFTSWFFRSVLREGSTQCEFHSNRLVQRSRNLELRVGSSSRQYYGPLRGLVHRIFGQSGENESEGLPRDWTLARSPVSVCLHSNILTELLLIRFVLFQYCGNW